ncbi:MAG TPA: response regulator [Pyrinomonadaceae bacterium]|jgi:CheY-like chemotaxis protein/anti-sigma regulatory factor (Ser/Thr protein kinase)
MAKRILVVDDDPELHNLIGFALKKEGYEVSDAMDAIEGLKMIKEDQFDLALLDIMMPKMDGLEMLSRLREHNKELRVVIMTALSTPEAALSAMRDHASDFLAKPFDLNQLLSIVKNAFHLEPEKINIEVLSARPEWIELRVPCDPAAIEPLDRLMSQLKTDLPRITRESVTYAFREMLRNAIEHGGKNDPTQFVEVGYLRSPRMILYRIKDPGEGFSIESLYQPSGPIAAFLNPEGDPMLHERAREDQGLRPGGFGILIARDMVDEMIYNERHNEVVLIKYLDGEKQQQQA